MEVKLFDIVNSINEKKEIDYTEAVKEYTPFLINKALSMHHQTVFFANMMNEHSNLDKDIQFDFYMNAVPKGKRFGKWQKLGKVEQDITNIMSFYSINRRRAEELLCLFSERQLTELADKRNQGGFSKK